MNGMGLIILCQVPTHTTILKLALHAPMLIPYTSLSATAHTMPTIKMHASLSHGTMSITPQQEYTPTNIQTTTAVPALIPSI